MYAQTAFARSTLYVIMSYGCSDECWRFFVSVQALFCFSAGTLLFQCWHSGTLLFSIECFSAGTLAQEGRAIWAFGLLSAGTLALKCFQGNASVPTLWHLSVLGSGIHPVSN